MSTDTFTTTVKSGRGMTHGVVSELTAFLDVEPGHAEELRAGLERFHARVRKAPWAAIEHFGIVDMRHAIFDNGTRLLWITAFDTDWDPYIDDSIAGIGIDGWQDWLQHTAGYEFANWDTSAKVKRNLQAAQVPATGFYRAIPDLTLGQVKRAQRLAEVFDKVLDDPAAVEALQASPALEALLDEAAG